MDRCHNYWLLSAFTTLPIIREILHRAPLYQFITGYRLCAPGFYLSKIKTQRLRSHACSGLIQQPFMPWDPPFHWPGELGYHWGRVTHICVGNLTTIGSDSGLSPGRHQAIIWTNTGILLIQTLGTNVSEILSQIDISSFKKMHLKLSSVKCQPFCLGLNVLKTVLTPVQYRTAMIKF